MSWNYILFDLDGTLTDSREGIIKCICYALEAAKVSIPDEETLLRFIGPPLVEGFQDLAGMEYEAALEATAKYRERYSIVGLFENEMYDGIKDVLKELKKQGKKIALATSKPEIYATRILDYFEIGDYFDEVAGATIDGARNTKVAVIEEALLRLGISKEQRSEVLMIGDRKHDILGAKECSIASLGVRYGFAADGELEAAGADFMVSDVEELLAFFNK